MPEPEVPGLWRDFLKACRSPAQNLQKEKAVWEAWERVVPFLRGESYVSGDEDRFRSAINAFTESFIARWGEGHVTHYMHILYAHGPWLIKEHGSLGVWQCQGMEKSHWRARGDYQKHTNHDGGRQARDDLKGSSLYQLLRYDYRMLQHRRRYNAGRVVREKVKEENDRRKKAAQAVWSRWYESADQETKAGVAASAEAARAVRRRNLIAIGSAKYAARRELMRCHGLISSFEESNQAPHFSPDM